MNLLEQTRQSLKKKGKTPLILFSGNPNEHGVFFPHTLLRQAYEKAQENLVYHPDPKGLAVAREAIHHWYATKGVVIDPEQVLLTSGTSESCLYLFSTLAPKGEQILVPQPAYPLFDPIADITGTHLVPYKLDAENAWKIDRSFLEHQITPGTKAIFLVSPHNPTGSVVDRDDIQWLSTLCHSRGVVLVCDEVFSEFYFGEDDYQRPMKVADFPVCITLNGISKMLALPSLKLSWIVITGSDHKRKKQIVEQLERLNDTFLSCHTLIQKALPILLSEGQTFLRTFQQTLRQRRQHALSLLTQNKMITFQPPQGGFYLMFHLDKNLLSPDLPHDDEQLAVHWLREKEVFIHPGYLYDYEEQLSFVISFLTGERTFTEAWSRVML